MPPIYYLNPPPNPFWDFVAGIEDHPFFTHYRGAVPPPPPARPGTEQTQTQATATAAAAEASEKAKGKQPETYVEDPPEVDPSTIRPEGKDKDTSMPFRGRGRFAKAFEGDEKDDEKGRHRGGPGWRGHHGHWRGGHHGPHPFGPPPFMFGPRFGPWGPPPPPPVGGQEGPEGRGPFGGFRGRGGCPRGRHGHHGGPHSRSPPREHRSGGFDLSAFLNRLGERLGVDLSSAAEGLGLDLDRFKSRSNDSDFEPRTDIFDTTTQYIIHISLPGAKKSDVGVEWDGEHSVLRVTGVVHRPGVDEETMTHLVVDGRKRETGVFEKNVRLGTQKEPACVDVQGITAKMVDGVLVVQVPKVEKKFEKKEVRVDGSSPEVSTERPEDAYMNENDLLFDAQEDRDEEMYDAEPTRNRPFPAKATLSETSKSKQKEAEREARDDRSETVGFEHENETVETLPRYEAEDTSHRQHAGEEEMSDWEKAGSEDEGEYVKINVD
ncbi:uncharacterized protein Z518_02655 [Rhinocladiella mackenziei CBS 650.93]|uniref:SHSP domain-containing protein n=1 Tax=Rhinocladiella mackenziei CBS 650.93 TaxID=1442369 RepID=A0A0D2JFI5_9EURO|nr:uncharacterized protein Z518_02655 [Rhinocladiella mackenziei CBS 650.93]KIX08000.1 hypothetical protein Z518_02655 [Rhinocladiella mackenziei CBS 650.93]